MIGLSDVLACDVSRETIEQLSVYETLLKKWNPRINLVSPTTLATADTRHFKDSAQLHNLIPKDAKALLDLGSGGGFPGLVLAILSHETHPDSAMTLVESDHRKATFLRTVIRETGLSTAVEAQRAESLQPQNANLLTARAMAPLDKLIGYAQRHLSPSGTALFPKGKDWQKEVDHARKQWKFALKTHRSQTDPSAVILDIRDIANA